MNLYDVLRELVRSNHHWKGETDQRDALEAIDTAEAWEVFGSNAWFANKQKEGE